MKEVLLAALVVLIAVLVVVTTIHDDRGGAWGNLRVNSEACTLALNFHGALVANDAGEDHIRTAYRDVVRACDWQPWVMP